MLQQDRKKLDNIDVQRNGKVGLLGICEQETNKIL